MGWSNRWTNPARPAPSQRKRRKRERSPEESLSKGLALPGLVAEPDHDRHPHEDENAPDQPLDVVVAEKHAPLGDEDPAQVKAPHHAGNGVRNHALRRPEGEIDPAEAPEVLEKKEVVHHVEGR